VNLNGEFARRIDRTEDREKFQRHIAGINGRVRRVFGNVRHLAWLQDALLAIDPLLRDPFKHVDNLFAPGMRMKLVRLPRLKSGADEQDVLRSDNLRIRHPFHMAPRHVAVLHVFGRDEVAWHAPSVPAGAYAEKLCFGARIAPLSFEAIQR
jgi:hypothetical protein